VSFTAICFLQGGTLAATFTFAFTGVGPQVVPLDGSDFKIMPDASDLPSPSDSTSRNATRLLGSNSGNIDGLSDFLVPSPERQFSLEDDPDMDCVWSCGQQ
jgi:hypothetical protein